MDILVYQYLVDILVGQNVLDIQFGQDLDLLDLVDIQSHCCSLVVVLQKDNLILEEEHLGILKCIIFVNAL